MISGRAGSTILLFRQARCAGLTVVTVRRVTGLGQQREIVQSRTTHQGGNSEHSFILRHNCLRDGVIGSPPHTACAFSLKQHGVSIFFYHLILRKMPFFLGSFDSCQHHDMLKQNGRLDLLLTTKLS